MLIHQIWLGDSIPKDLQQYMSAWENIPGTTYKLWRDKDLEVYHEDLVKANISKLYVTFKSDLLRNLILRDHGGLYLDTDCEKVGDIPNFTTYTCVKNPSPHWPLPDNYIIYSPKDSVQINEIIDYGYNKVPRWINTFNRFGSGAIIALYGSRYCIDSRPWCIHHHRFSWIYKQRQESVIIQPYNIGA
jgi:hypothetical protein